MKSKKKIGIVLVVLLILILIILSCWYGFKLKEEKEYISKYFQDKDTTVAIRDEITLQLDKAEEIKKILNQDSYTFDNPYLLVDPYGVSPLTALIIFQTSDDVAIEVSINDVKVTKMEASKIHSIPIYGLRAGVMNKVTLSMNQQTKDVMIDRSDVILPNLDVEQVNPNVSIADELYFLSISLGNGTSAYDGNGNIVWRLNGNASLDIEFLKNGHMYLSNGAASGVMESYDGFYEVDYFGKIYKNYSLANGYHHDLISLEDGSVIVIGGSDSNTKAFVGSFIYQINVESGEILNSLELYDLFKDIDEEFADNLLDKNIQVNSVYYDEKSKEMVLSLRGINTVLSVNFDSKKLNWIFADPSFYSQPFQKYLLQVTDNSRYPKGQHTATLTKEGYLSIFNNDFDMVNTDSEDIMDFKDNYSSATIYKIDGKNISTIWNYDANQQYFSYELGSFYTLEDHSKLINFGWTFYPFAFKPNLKIYDNLASTYGRIIELNDKDEEIFNAIYNGGIYRAYKHRMYEDVTANYLDFDYQLVNNNSNFNLEKIKTKDLFEEFDEAIDNPYEFELTTHTLTMNVGFDGLDVVDLYFVSEDYNTYLMHYKKMNEPTPSSLHLKLDGNYAVYFKINDVMYDTGKILSFD